MLKKVLAAVFILALGVSLLPAQVLVNEGVNPMSLGDRNALSVFLAGMSDKLVETSWKDYLTQYGKTKKSKGEWVTEDVVLSSKIMFSPVNLFAKINESEEGTTLTVWFDLRGTFLASTLEPEKYAAAEEFLEEFISKVTKDNDAANFTIEQIKLQKLQSRLDKLSSKYRSYEDEIRKAENKLANARQNMQENLLEQTEIQGQIYDQNMAIQEMELRLK